MFYGLSPCRRGWMGFWASRTGSCDMRREKRDAETGVGRLSCRSQGPQADGPPGRCTLAIRGRPHVVRWGMRGNEVQKDWKRSWSQPVLWPMSRLVGTRTTIKTDFFGDFNCSYSPWSPPCLVHVERTLGEASVFWVTSSVFISSDNCYVYWNWTEVLLYQYLSLSS